MLYTVYRIAYTQVPNTYSFIFISNLKNSRQQHSHNFSNLRHDINYDSLINNAEAYILCLLKRWALDSKKAYESKWKESRENEC